jgi:CcmD family protein
MLLSLSLLAAAPVGVALAQDAPPADDAASSRSAAFEAARGAQVEQVPGGALLVAAYGVVWVLLLGYVVSLGFRQSRVARELDRLRQDVSAQGREER